MFRPTWCTFVAVIVTFVLACSFALQAQDAPPTHPPRPKVIGPAKWVPSAQQVSVAYWTLEPGWSTTIEMRNNVAYHDLRVTPVLRSETGQETALAPVTIAPQHIVSLDLGSTAALTGKNIGPFGSLVLRFDGLDAANLFAAAIVRQVGEPIDFHFDGRDASPSLSSTGVEGMWWIPGASSTDYLILSNPLNKAVSGTLMLSSGFASHRPLIISLGPGQTKRINVREVLGPSSNGSVGGITLSLPNKELIWATQIVFDETTGFSAMMKMFERLPDDKAQPRVLRAPMMAMMQPDPGLGFPSGTALVPQMFLRNASQAAMQVSAAIDWRDQNSGTFALPTLSLAAGEVKRIRLADYQQAGQIPSDANWATVRLSYAGQRADLVAIAASYDKTHRYGLQTPFSEDLSRLWAGGMWHVDPTHNTLITTGNGGSEPTTAEVTLFYNGGKSKYRTEKLLARGQQLWLDLGHLIHDQIVDSDGNTLPPDTMSGSYELRDLDHGYVGQLFEGKLVIDKTYGHAAYGCGSCCGYNRLVVFDPSTFVGPVSIDGGETIDATDACLGGLVDITGDANDWVSSDTAVATLSPGTIHTVGVGTATGSAEAELAWAHPPSCPNFLAEPQQQENVQPSISGPNTVWWFKGQNPNATNYPISITLTAECGSSGCSATPQWSVSQSDSKVSLSATSGTQITVTSTGTYFSSSVGDISFTVSVNSVSSPAFTITSRTPWELVPDPLDSNTESDSSTGYSTYVASTLNDQLASNMASDFAWNESVGTPQNANGSNWASCCGPLHSSGGTGSPVLDYLAPPQLASNPSPKPTYNSPPSGSVAYMLATQNIYIGSNTSGAGVFVQQDTLTYYIDHGAYTGIIIPPKPPQ